MKIKKAYKISYLIEKPKIVQYRIAQAKINSKVFEFAQVTVKIHAVQVYKYIY